jgi:quercetin dioxygenase-like cupin family protein
MKIIHYTDANPRHFDSETVKGVTGRVVIGKADGAEKFCMRFFEIAKDGYSPRHSHAWEHEIIIFSGTGEVLCEENWIPISPGKVIFIPGNEDHQIRNAGDVPLVFACMIPSGPPEL